VIWPLPPALQLIDRYRLVAISGQHGVVMRISVAFLILSLLAALGMCAMPACLAGDTGTLKLDQSCQGLGHVITYVSPQAFRVERGDVIIISRGPDWKVCSVNKERKLFIEQSFEKGLKSVNTFGASSSAFIDAGLSWKKGEKGTVAGLPAYLWRSDPVYSSPGEKAHKATSIRYWLYCDQLASKQCNQYLSSMYGVPLQAGGGVPLRLSFFGKISAVVPIASRAAITEDPACDHFWLDTKSASKVSVPKSIFEVPKDCKKTTDLTSLYLGVKVTKSNDIIQDLLKNPDALFQAR
jgi:hypothetical protein